MRRFLRFRPVAIYSALLLLALGTIIVVDSAPAAAQGDPVRILPLGNSITQGEGRARQFYPETPRDSYRRPLWQKLEAEGCAVDFVGSSTTNFKGPAPNPDFDLDHEGHWGWRTDEILDGNPDAEAGSGSGRLSEWLDGYTPDIALVHLGSNDVFQEQSNASTIDELNAVINQLRIDNPSVTILFAQLIPADSPFNDKITALNRDIATLANDKSIESSPVIIVDQNTGFNAITDTYDNVHPNAIGEEKMAQTWFNALLPLLPCGAAETPTVMPTVMPTMMPTVMPTVTATLLPPSATPTAVPPVQSPTATPNVTQTGQPPSPTVTASPTGTPEQTPPSPATSTPAATASPAPSAEPTATVSSTEAPSATISPTPLPTPLALSPRQFLPIVER